MLPFIGLNVPLVGFYIIIPIFVIALHFNFLQNLASHHYKLICWQKSHPGGVVPRSRLYPFLFDHAILDRSSQFMNWVWNANSFLCYELAPITLALLLIRYTDRQDIFMTTWHAFVFVCDILLLWKMKLALDENQYSEWSRGTKKTHCESPLQLLDVLLYTSRFFAPIPYFVLFEFILTLLIATTSDNFFVAYVLHPTQLLTRGDTRINEWYLPRIKIDSDEVVWFPDIKELEAAAKLAGQDSWVKYFYEHGKGFKPAPHSLRLLSLSQQNLPLAQFKDGRLQGADLRGVHMQGADLSGAQIQGANLTKAQMQGTNLRNAQMQEINMYFASMQGSNLSGANLQWAFLEGTKLQGAVLELAQMQGANLQYAQMQGADLYGAEMQGTLLGSANLQGAFLEEAQLQGAILDRTYVQGASGTSEIAVFSPNGRYGLFDDEKPDWGSIEKLAEAIPDSKEQEEFRQRIQNASKPSKIEEAEQNFRYLPTAIAKMALLSLCKGGNRYDNEIRISGAQEFRNRYFYLSKVHEFKDIKQNQEYQGILKDIDRTLCTLELCADIRDDIEGLDCKPYTKNQIKKP